MKKFPKKKFLMRFLNSVTVPKNVKGGTLCDFLTSIVLQNIETNEGGPSGAIQKTSKKVLKKSGAKLCFQGCGRLFCFFFSFWTRF